MSLDVTNGNQTVYEGAPNLPVAPFLCRDLDTDPLTLTLRHFSSSLLGRFTVCFVLTPATMLAVVSREQWGGRSELVFSFHLLLCCVEYVIRLTPSFQLKAPFGMF